MKYNIIFIGNNGVGKSTLISRYIKNNNNENPHIKRITINDINIKMRIYEISKISEIESIGSEITNNNVIFIMYSVVDKNSYNIIYDFYKILRKYKPIDIILLANKIDYPIIHVDNKLGQKLSNKIGADYYEISVKYNYNCNNIIEKTLNKIIYRNIINESSYLLNTKKKLKRFCCLF
jgi:GTPase SAR1 family protein